MAMDEVIIYHGPIFTESCYIQVNAYAINNKKCDICISQQTKGISPTDIFKQDPPALSHS